MKTDELGMKLRDYLLNPSGETGQELLDIVNRLLNSRIIIIEKCSECPNFNGAVSPRPGCRRTNQLIDGDEPTCDLNKLKTVSTLLSAAFNENYIKAHYEEEK